MTNPLLQPHILPPFNTIRAEHVVPAITSLVKESKRALDEQLGRGKIDTWQGLIEPLEAREDKISQAWAPISHLNSVMNSEELREAYENADKILSDYYSELGQNEVLYKAYLCLEQSEGFTTFNQEQKQTIANAIRDFTLSGVALTGEDKSRFKAIRSELSGLTTQF